MHQETTLAGTTVTIPTSVKTYKLTHTLGKGKNSVVKLAENGEGRQFAIKIVPVSLIESKHLGCQIQNSIKMATKFNHTNVLKLYDSFEADGLLYIVTEYCERRSLFEVLSTAGRLGESRSRKYFTDIINAISYLHSMSFAHRCLSFKAFLVDGDDNVKLRHFDHVTQLTAHQLLNAQCGSPVFSPPEVIMNTPYEGKNVDMWALGVILYTMVAGEIPWKDDDPTRLLGKICTGLFQSPNHFSPQLRDLISGLLVVDASRRLECVDVMRHPWMVSNKTTTPLQRAGSRLGSHSMVGFVQPGQTLKGPMRGKSYIARPFSMLNEPRKKLHPNVVASLCRRF